VIRLLKKAWPVSLMCRLLKVPRSSYYAFAERPPKTAASPPLLKAVRQIHSEPQQLRQSPDGAGTAGAGLRDRTLTARSLMREAQLTEARRRTHRYLKAEGEALIAPNLLERQFELGATNRVWRAIAVGRINSVNTLAQQRRGEARAH
jgi:putative transposase